MARHLDEFLLKLFPKRMEKLAVAKRMVERAGLRAQNAQIALGRKELKELVRAKQPPPQGSTFLLACLARPGRADEVLGDAETEYRQMIVRIGPVCARWLYRVYVVKVAGRMLPGCLMRVLLMHKLIGLLGL